jgi:hypothetical protein
MWGWGDVNEEDRSEIKQREKCGMDKWTRFGDRKKQENANFP